MSLLVSMSQINKGGILNRLKQVLTRSENLQPLVQPAHDLLWRANRDRALRGEDWQGRAYAPLAEATLADRKRKGFAPGPILVRHGEDADVIRGCKITVAVERGKLRFAKNFEGTTNFHIEGGPNLTVRDPLGWGSEILVLREMVPRHVLGR